MRSNAIPAEFEDLLSPAGKRVLAGTHALCGALADPKRRFLARRRSARPRQGRRRAPRARGARWRQARAASPSRSRRRRISGMRRDYGELLPKTSRARTIYLRQPARARREGGGADRPGADDALGLVPRLRRGAGRPQAARRAGACRCCATGRATMPARTTTIIPRTRPRGAATSTCISACARRASRTSGWSTAAPAISARSSRSPRPATVTAYRLPFWHYTTPLVPSGAARGGALGAAGDVPLPQ